MTQFSFRHKVLVLAVALIMATQLVTLFPVLDAIKRDADAQAKKSVGLAAVLLDEYMRNRGVQLLTTVNVLVSDFGFKQAAAGGDHAQGDAEAGHEDRRYDHQLLLRTTARWHLLRDSRCDAPVLRA